MEARDGCGLVVLDRAGCLELLGIPRVGCLAVTDQAMPVVLPVAYALDNDRLVMRLASGSLLGRAAPNRVVGFGVHSGDLQRFGGWSVSVTGFAQPIPEPLGLVHRPQGPLGGWADGHDVWIALSTERMTGRWLVPARQPVSARAPTT
jgi:hypothetical protein